MSDGGARRHGRHGQPFHVKRPHLKRLLRWAGAWAWREGRWEGKKRWLCAFLLHCLCHGKRHGGARAEKESPAPAMSSVPSLCLGKRKQGQDENTRKIYVYALKEKKATILLIYTIKGGRQAAGFGL